MPSILDIEHPESLIQYLRASNHIESNEVPAISVLKGGVSNRTVLVQRKHGQNMVIKQALRKLRVREDWYCDPSRIHQEALGLIWLRRLVPKGAITPLLFEDPEHHLLAMQAVPAPHANWKTCLLADGPADGHIEQFGRLLATIHQNALDRSAELSTVFSNRTFFEHLRLEPYYRFTATRVPQAANFLNHLIEETLATRLTLVHGDYSPKNILVRQGRLILLDHEVIHWGDSAFDLGFSLTHLLSKAFHLQVHRARFFYAARHFWETYQQFTGNLTCKPELEARAVRHTLACLLARVQGRSPLEYLMAAECSRLRSIVLGIMKRPPANLPELFNIYARALA